MWQQQPGLELATALIVTPALTFGPLGLLVGGQLRGRLVRRGRSLNLHRGVDVVQVVLRGRALVAGRGLGGQGVVTGQPGGGDSGQPLTHVHDGGVRWFRGCHCCWKIKFYNIF